VARNGFWTARTGRRVDIFSGAGKTFGRDQPQPLAALALAGGTDVAAIRRVPVEIVIGRWLACCARPAAAWHVLPASGRALLVGAYAMLGFALAYVTLLLV